MAPRPLSVLSLCSGVGMLDLGLHAAFAARTVCYVEREAFAASQLVALMESGLLDAAPVWSDLATFDARAWRGRVDCIIAGLPCQPYSAAGKREGNDDRRSWGEGDGPIPHFLRIVDESRPAVVWLENVTAWVMGGFFRPVGEELCRLGYELEKPLLLAASDVGASHQRERVFIMAHDASRGLGILRGALEQGRGRHAHGGDAQLGDGHGEIGRERDREPGHFAAAAGARHERELEDAARHGGDRPHGEGGRGRGVRGTGGAMGYAGHGREGAGERWAGWGQPAQRPITAGDELAQPDGEGSQGGGRDDGTEGRQEPHGHAGLAGGALADDERGGREDLAGLAPQRREPDFGLCGGSLFAPGPLDARWARIIADHPHLAPATEPGVRGLAHGFAWLVDESRRHQLRAIGNGAVPLCFAVAVRTLARRAVERARLKRAA